MLIGPFYPTAPLTPFLPLPLNPQFLTQSLATRTACDPPQSARAPNRSLPITEECRTVVTSRRANPFRMMIPDSILRRTLAPGQLVMARHRSSGADSRPHAAGYCFEVIQDPATSACASLRLKKTKSSRLEIGLQTQGKVASKTSYTSLERSQLEFVSRLVSS